jgi:hypothetical protein
MCPQGCDAPPVREQLFVRTMAGRDVRVGRTTLGDTGAPGRDVSLHIGHAPDGENGAGAALTPAEARQLAAALLQQSRCRRRRNRGCHERPGGGGLSRRRVIRDRRARPYATDRPASNRRRRGHRDDADRATHRLAQFMCRLLRGPLPDPPRAEPRRAARHRHVHHRDRPASPGRHGQDDNPGPQWHPAQPPGRPPRGGITLHRAQHTSPTPRHSHRTEPTPRPMSAARLSRRVSAPWRRRPRRPANRATMRGS